MKTLVIFYSYAGAVRALAQKLAGETGADLYEVEYQKRPSLFGTFLRCPAAMGQRSAKNVKPIAAKPDDYDKIVIMGPIWAGLPAPPVNNIIRLLPAGKQVELRLVSASGKSNKEKVTALVKGQGCTVTDYLDIASGAAPSQ